MAETNFAIELDEKKGRVLVAKRNLFGNTFGKNSEMYWEIFGEEVFSPTKRALTDASSFNTFPWKTFRIQHIL